MINSKKTINRRTLVAGTMGIVASTALPENSQAKPADPVLTATLAGMAEAMEGVNVMEVLSNVFAPHYRKGDLIFVKPQCGKATDHVFIKRMAADPAFGVLVHHDAKAIYVTGFKAGDRLQSVPLNTITEWGRIVANYRV